MSKELHANVIAGFNLKPALIAPTYVDFLSSNLGNLRATNLNEEKKNVQSAQADMLSSYGVAGSDDKPFAYADGIAFIPVAGLLINRFNYSFGGWVTGYNYIRSQLNMALMDDDVKGIVFDVNSGGGQVAGCFELVDDIYASRQVKPSVAIIDASCYSAAYAIASAATKMIITPSGGAGSVGVVATHFDFSKAMDDYGVKVTFIYSGDQPATCATIDRVASTGWLGESASRGSTRQWRSMLFNRSAARTLFLANRNVMSLMTGNRAIDSATPKALVVNNLKCLWAAHCGR